MIAGDRVVICSRRLHYRGPVLLRRIRVYIVVGSRLSFKVEELALVQPRVRPPFLLYLLVEWVFPKLLPSDRVVDLLPPKAIRNDSSELLRLLVVLVVVDFLDRRLGVMDCPQHQKIAVDLLFQFPLPGHEVQGSLVLIVANVHHVYKSCFYGGAETLESIFAHTLSRGTLRPRHCLLFGRLRTHSTPISSFDA